MLLDDTEALEPELRPVKGGWAASGHGWAVHGKTPDDATTRFREAKRLHRLIDSRPYWYERLQALNREARSGAEM